MTVTGAAARDELLVKVRRAVDVHGHYVHEAPAEQRVANLELGAAAWIRFKAAREAAPGTIKALTSGWTRIGRDIRRVEGIGASAAIPTSVLSRDLVTKLLDAWAGEGLSAQRRYDLVLYVHRAWLWMCDDPEAWPGVPPAPRDSSTVLPPAPIRGAAPDAPTLAEVDAICRRAAASPVADLADIVATLRLTGLRIGQVLAMRVADLDLTSATLVVTAGKSRREKADQREIPVHRELITRLARRIDGAAPSRLVFTPALLWSVRRKLPTTQVRALWEAATAAGEVREHVWKPRNRGKARPDHAFRAAFLAALGEAKVAEAVRFELVGHAPATTEGRHYARPTAADLRAAVDALAAIDWIGPEVLGNVVPIGVGAG